MSGFAELADAAWQASKAGRDLDARLLLGAAVTTLAPKGARPVIVGGTAVDFWAADTTGGSLEPSRLIRASQDVDIVVAGFYGDAKKLRLAMLASGNFKPASDGIAPESCRAWIGTSMPIMVEIIGDELAGDPDRVATVDIGDGTVYLWGIEDTLWQYAENTVSQRDRNDWARALAIAGAQEPDWDYIKSLAEASQMEFLVEALQGQWSYDEVLDAA